MLTQHDLFPESLKRGRGRPCTGNAKSAAERMRAYRSRQKDNPVTVTKNIQTVPFSRAMELQQQLDIVTLQLKEAQRKKPREELLAEQLHELRKQNAILKGQVTALKNKFSSQTEALRFLVGCYVWVDAETIHPSIAPYEDTFINNEHLEGKWRYAYELLNS